MDSLIDQTRVCAIENKLNTFGGAKTTDSSRRQRRQSFVFESMRNRKDDYRAVDGDRRTSSNIAVPLQRCQSYAVTMRQQSRAINRNGTIARNQFRGIRRDVLESQTQHIIRSMTVSIFQFNWPMHPKQTNEKDRNSQTQDIM